MTNEEIAVMVAEINEDGKELIKDLIMSIARSTRYTTTDETLLHQYHEDEKKAAEQIREDKRHGEAARDERIAFESTPRYERNETMQRLGNNCIAFGSADNRAEFEDVCSANKYDMNYDIAIDFYMLGVMHGKRSDRERRKANR